MANEPAKETNRVQKNKGNQAKQYKYKYMANQAEQTNCIKQSKPNKNTAKNMANQAEQTKLTKELRSRGR